MVTGVAGGQFMGNTVEEIQERQEQEIIKIREGTERGQRNLETEKDNLIEELRTRGRNEKNRAKREIQKSLNENLVKIDLNFENIKNQMQLKYIEIMKDTSLVAEEIKLAAKAAAWQSELNTRSQEMQAALRERQAEIRQRYQEHGATPHNDSVASSLFSHRDRVSAASQPVGSFTPSPSVSLPSISQSREVSGKILAESINHTLSRLPSLEESEDTSVSGIGYSATASSNTDVLPINGPSSGDSSLKFGSVASASTIDSGTPNSSTKSPMISGVTRRSSPIRQ